MTPPPGSAWTFGKMDPRFPVVYAKFWPYHLNVIAEMCENPNRSTVSEN